MNTNNGYPDLPGSPNPSLHSNTVHPAAQSADIANLLVNLNDRLQLLESRNRVLENHPSPKVSLPEKFSGYFETSCSQLKIYSAFNQIAILRV